MRKYPTKREIMEEKVPFSEELQIAMKKWKVVTWKEARGDKKKKKAALTKLVKVLNTIFDRKTKIQYKENLNSALYSTKTDTISMNSSLSIISTLHEYGHAMFGVSELIACRWSVQLFILTFPKAYAKLKWEKHMLKTK